MAKEMDAFAKIKEQLRIAREKLNMKPEIIEQEEEEDSPTKAHIKELEMDLGEAMHYRALVENKLANELKERTSVESKMQETMEHHLNQLKQMEQRKYELESQLKKAQEDILRYSTGTSSDSNIPPLPSPASSRSIPLHSNGHVEVTGTMRFHSPTEIIKTNQRGQDITVLEDQIKLADMLQKLDDSVRKRENLLTTETSPFQSDDEEENEVPDTVKKNINFMTPAAKILPFIVSEKNGSDLSYQFQEFRRSLASLNSNSRVKEKEEESPIVKEKEVAVVEKEVAVVEKEPPLLNREELAIQFKRYTLEAQWIAIRLSIGSLEPNAVIYEKLNTLRRDIQVIQTQLQQQV